MYSIKRAAAAGSRYTAKDFAEAAENISAALAGTPIVSIIQTDARELPRHLQAHRRHTGDTADDAA